MPVNTLFANSPKVTDFRSYDASAWSLVFANFFTIVLALFENWNLFETMLVYWFQNVIIGIINIIRIATFIGSQRLEKPEDQKNARMAAIFLSCFFAVHYGGFHWGYWSFLRGSTTNVNMGLVMLSAGVFLFNHLFSFFHNFKRDRLNQDPGDLARMMFFPYLRIIPMHVTIIVGMFILMIASLLKINFADKLVLVFFLILKTGSDVKMHLIEHEFGKKEQ